MLSDIGDGVSPVTGSSFPALSKEYKARKGEVASPVPNLELSGDLLDAFDVRVKGSQLEVGVFDGAQAGKADGNNRGTYGKTTRTRSRYARTFIPYRKDQKLSPRIRGAIKEVLEDYEE